MSSSDCCYWYMIRLGAMINTCFYVPSGAWMRRVLSSQAEKHENTKMAKNPRNSSEDSDRYYGSVTVGRAEIWWD